VIADAQLDATNDPGLGDAVVAFMNPGGIRADLVYNQISGGEQPGEVTYAEMFTVQPFGNSMVTMTLSGAQIETLLEQPGRLYLGSCAHPAGVSGLHVHLESVGPCVRQGGSGNDHARWRPHQPQRELSGDGE
jgi:hypothetical protein